MSGKKIIFFFGFVVNFLLILGQNRSVYEEDINTAQELRKMKKILYAAHAYHKAFVNNKGWAGRNDRMDAAECWALAGVADSAFVQLNIIIDKSEKRSNDILGKKDLASLHSDPRWELIVKKIKDKNAIIEQKEKEREALTEIQDDMVGKPLPEFSFTDVNGTKYNSGDLKGKVVVMNFWTTWCGPCRMEMPELNEIKEKFSGKEVLFVSFCSNIDSIRPLENFYKKIPFNYNTVIGEDAKKANELFHINAIPVNVVVDKKGDIVFLMTGYSLTTPSKIRKKIKSCLKGKA
jgi:thiol-disulfide isomerase/thioredoxin